MKKVMIAKKGIIPLKEEHSLSLLIIQYNRRCKINKTTHKLNNKLHEKRKKNIKRQISFS